MLDERTILVADDETSLVRAYRGEVGGAPIAEHDVARWIELDERHPEPDLEAAARIGDRVYWITSHGRNKKRKPRPGRHRFLALAVDPAAVERAPTGIGRAYRDLSAALLADPVFVRLGIEGTARDRVEIEGLSAVENALWIGLRSPQVTVAGSPPPRAVVVPLLNAAAVVERGEEPRFEAPLLWDLGGLGVRDMVHSDFHRATFVLAGAAEDRREFALYRWSERREDAPALVRPLGSEMPSFNPEAIVASPGGPRLLLLSDDGTLPVAVARREECLEPDEGPSGTCPNKFLRDGARRSFRGVWVTP
jgi:hypothetical protein